MTIEPRHVMAQAKDGSQGVARKDGKTHVVEKRDGQWVVTFTHLEGCQCNYCAGVYDKA